MIAVSGIPSIGQSGRGIHEQRDGTHQFPTCLGISNRIHESYFKRIDVFGKDIGIAVQAHIGPLQVVTLRIKGIEAIAQIERILRGAAAYEYLIICKIDSL
jgi:hypothetical protein